MTRNSKGNQCILHSIYVRYLLPTRQNLYFTLIVVHSVQGLGHLLHTDLQSSHVRKEPTNYYVHVTKMSHLGHERIPDFVASTKATATGTL